MKVEVLKSCLDSQTYKDWVGDGVIIVRPIDNSTVIAITKHKDVYNVYRLFTPGTRWEVSHDVISKDEHAAFDYVFDLIN